MFSRLHKGAASVVQRTLKFKNVGFRSKIKPQPRFFHSNAYLMAEGKEAGEHKGKGKPNARPSSPNFGSGPTKKYPGFQSSAIPTRALGRSHRSPMGMKVLGEAIEKTKRVLGVPSDYRVGFVPGSDTGAFELAMWQTLGPNQIDCFNFESFGTGWYSDIIKELKIPDSQVNNYTADYGRLPDLSLAKPENDVVFTWNGTTSGVKVPNGDWISDNRTGLTLCDATSAVFAMDMPWEKLDITTYSWQKAVGGEAAHGVIILSPRAVERLESYKPSWPIPKLFRLTKKGKINEAMFRGSFINTPSMMCVEDYLLALEWVESMGGVAGTIAASEANLAVLEKWVSQTEGVSFLATDPNLRSNSSVCLAFDDLDAAQLKLLTSILADERVAFDIAAYRDAPAGLRIWCGPTVETTDVQVLTQWLTWALDTVKSQK